MRRHLLIVVGLCFPLAAMATPPLERASQPKPLAATSAAIAPRDGIKPKLISHLDYQEGKAIIYKTPKGAIKGVIVDKRGHEVREMTGAELEQQLDQ